jgi:DNA-binding NarL/FixJ family response regulator
VRTVLVCVRTTLAAQTIATSAARLGVAAAVRTALTAGEALAHLAAEPAELVLADTALCRPDSPAFVRAVLAAAPSAAVILFGVEEPHVATAAIAAGARGVIRADPADPVILVAKALLLLLGQPTDGQPHTGRPGTDSPGTGWPGSGWPGTGWAGSGNGTAAVDPPRRRVDLTERELQVLRGMAEGKSNAEIGRELFVSEDTVKTHARRLFRKLGARDRAHAVAAAFRAGLVS